ncbi:MAG: hypothetical protein H6823_14360, partial [Planctomycetaceae bacterium]|nr:hypothetical protein [Planctomycetaceae bacterium]
MISMYESFLLSRWTLALLLLLLLASVHAASGQTLPPLTEIERSEYLLNSYAESSHSLQWFGTPEAIERGQSMDFEYESHQDLITKFDDGVTFSTVDEEFELRIRIMEQTDFKLFLPRNQEPARPGA